ncbi:MAG: riboflavin synthase [Betaproteobacteria bacterium]|nr:riboflavin synthase [Betaproteobacteria bacterium]
MFTGIVAAVGHIDAVKPAPGGVRLRISAGGLGLDDVAPGDSIAVSGACLTVVTFDQSHFEAEVSQATLDCVAGFSQGAAVNLEKALRLSDRLGGHLMTGHVDGVGVVSRFEAAGDNRRLVVAAPHAIARYIARKGSVAVDGVSLTVNVVAGDAFEVNLIPHTLASTTLQHLQPGARVNLEVDLLARYIERLHESGSTGKTLK